MNAPTIYGVISDIHRDPKIIKPAIDTLVKEGAQKLLINGDIGEPQPTLQASQDYIARILQTVAESGLESFVQPGSHETVNAFMPVLSYFAEVYPNIVNVFEQPSVAGSNHCLAFLPGSDWTAGGEFTIGNEDIETGTYLKSKEGLVPYSPENAKILSTTEPDVGVIHYQNMNDLDSRVREPEKTVVICHVPRKFSDPRIGIDMAYFAETADGLIIPGEYVDMKIRQSEGNISREEISRVAQQRGLKLKTENRGNEALGLLYDKLGVQRAVSGHFHESSHRAHTKSCERVYENVETTELYWNSGHLDEGKTGILRVNGNTVSYKNINLRL